LDNTNHRSDLEAKIFDLKEAIPHQGATVTGEGPLVVTTPAERWAFAASLPLHVDPAKPVAGHRRMIIRLDATVEEGEVGISIVSPDFTRIISGEDLQAAARKTFEVVLDNPRPGMWLTVRNTAPGGIASRVKIHGVEVAESPAGTVAETEIWLDVGAHLGEETVSFARNNPQIRVYAFEPNLRVASRMMGKLANYVVLPVAISEQDGCASLHVNRCSQASSLLPLTPEGVKAWTGGELLKVEETVTVPAMRLDTFLNQAGIAKVAYLKIDTQGADLMVLRSAGERLRDIERIRLEVQIAPVELYRGASRKEEVIAYLTAAGFELTACEKQTYEQEENLTFVLRTTRA
jgi:FkbM family methyltransferase